MMLPPPVLAHQLARFDRHKEIAADIHVHGFLEGAEVSVQHVAKLRVGRRVVDQDVDAAKVGADARKGLADLLHFTDMAGNGRGLATFGNDRIGYWLAALKFTARDNHMGPLLGQQFGDGFTDAAAGTGNKGDFAIKVEQLGPGHADSL